MSNVVEFERVRHRIDRLQELGEALQEHGSPPIDGDSDALLKWARTAKGISGEMLEIYSELDDLGVVLRDERL